MRAAARVVLPVLVPRAVVLWALIRLLIAAAPAAGGEALGSMPAPPIGVALVSGVVGLIDVRVRGETILWANLGVTRVALYGVYVTAAACAELVLALVPR